MVIPGVRVKCGRKGSIKFTGLRTIWAGYNVGCFMADLITDGGVWSEWKGKMPVIYNDEEEAD
jgi:hypothetical protein